jgi:hypothetical protein
VTLGDGIPIVAGKIDAGIQRPRGGPVPEHPLHGLRGIVAAFSSVSRTSTEYLLEHRLEEPRHVHSSYEHHAIEKQIL